MDITTLEDEVFGRYAGHCKMCEDGDALPDGCPDPTRYSIAPLRALFVLKDGYGNPHDRRQFDFYHPQYFKISPTSYLAMLQRNLRYHFPERVR